jgi:hypothetical protein
MKSKKALIISIIVFIIVAAVALYLVLNKGHIGNYSLVAVGEEEEVEEVILPQLSLEFSQDYLSSTNKKETVSMNVSIDGEEVTDGVEFETSDEKIVKINKDNELVAVSDGKVTIKAKYDGLEVTKDIRVITPIKSMTFTTTNSVVRVGKDLQMKLQVSPTTAYVNGLEYTSSDEDIAVVDSSGIVTGVSAGSVKITVYDPYSEIEKSVNLTIKK